MTKYFNDIPDELKINSKALIGRQVYMSINDGAMSINDLAFVTVKRIVSTTERDELGIKIIGEERLIHEDLSEEINVYTGRAIYLSEGGSKIKTSNGIKLIIACYDEFGPFFKIIDPEEAKGRCYINGVFRYKGIFFYFKVSGNYLFKDEIEANEYLQILDDLPDASITSKGMIVDILGDDFLVDKYTISINKQKYKDNKFKDEVYKNIRKDMGLTDDDKKNIELIFRRCVIKCIV